MNRCLYLRESLRYLLFIQHKNLPPLGLLSIRLQWSRVLVIELRATSHTRLRACDHYTSSTLIGRKGGAGPSSLLHATFEGPTECVNARWMWSLHGFLQGIERIMFHGCLDYFHKPALGDRPNTKTRRPRHSKRPQPLVYSILSCVRTSMNRNSFKWHLIEGPVTYGFALHLRVRDHTTYMSLEVCWDGLWTLSFWALTISRSRHLARVWSGPHTWEIFFTSARASGTGRTFTSSKAPESETMG